MHVKLILVKYYCHGNSLYVLNSLRIRKCTKKYILLYKRVLNKFDDYLWLLGVVRHTTTLVQIFGHPSFPKKIVEACPLLSRPRWPCWKFAWLPCKSWTFIFPNYGRQKCDSVTNIYHLANGNGFFFGGGGGLLSKKNSLQVGILKIFTV